ncbi:MAG: AraC family transcriptional regulator [Pseudomonadota bacterium]
MTVPAGLYERAIREKSAALLHAGQGSSFWAGAAGTLGRHQGGAPVLLAGLYGKFRLRLPSQPWVLCSAALIPAGQWHELDFSGEPFAALYVEPGQGGFAALMPLVRAVAPIEGALIGETDLMPALRNLYEDLSSESWVEVALDDLVGFARRRTKASTFGIDQRVAEVISLIENRQDGAGRADELARRVGLSSSRFQHLFTQYAGVPLRRYRAWCRLRRAWLEIAKGATTTHAAHAAGFFDSAHLAHDYRRTFGAMPSNGLRRIYRVSGSAIT